VRISPESSEMSTGDLSQKQRCEGAIQLYRVRLFVCRYGRYSVWVVQLTRTARHSWQNSARSPFINTLNNPYRRRLLYTLLTADVIFAISTGSYHYDYCCPSPISPWRRPISASLSSLWSYGCLAGEWRGYDCWHVGGNSSSKIDKTTSATVRYTVHASHHSPE